jgi:hypothetical protein
MILLLEKIVELGEDFLFSLLGEIGIGLFNFASKAEKTNPQLNYLSCAKNAEVFLQILDLSKHAKDKGFDSAFQLISKNAQLIAESFKEIAISKDGIRHIRFFSKEEREKLRSLRKKYKFCSLDFQNKVAQLEHKTPSDICFLEKDKNISVELRFYENIHLRFKSLGCEELSNKALIILNKLKFSSEDYFGFKRIEIADAACLLAKINNFNFLKEKVTIDSNQCLFNINPFREHAEKASEKVTNTITHAENFGYPFFDDYIILSPSFGRSFEGQSQNVEEYESDDSILTNKIFKSFVLGDKDGECYFICLWD